MNRRMNMIKDAYERVNNLLLFENNTEKNRLKTRELLKILLDFVVNDIICDETNNTPEIIDNNQMVARVWWEENGNQKYVDLTFGDVNITWEAENLPEKHPSRDIDELESPYKKGQLYELGIYLGIVDTYPFGENYFIRNHHFSVPSKKTNKVRKINKIFIRKVKK